MSSAAIQEITEARIENDKNIDGQGKLSATELMTASGTKIYLHSGGGIDITASPGSPVNVRQMSVDGLPRFTGSSYSSYKSTEPSSSPHFMRSEKREEKLTAAGAASSKTYASPETELEQLKSTLRKLTADDMHLKSRVDSNVNSSTNIPSHTNDESGGHWDTKPSYAHSTSYLNQSMMSNASAYRSETGAGSGNSSKAVLSALRALQDKIRRVEIEKEEIMAQYSNLKIEARKKEATSLAREQKSMFDLTQTKEAARAAYEEIRSDRDSIRIKLVQSEERVKSLEKDVAHYKSQTITLDSSQREMFQRNTSLEKRNTQLKEDLRNSQQLSELKMTELKETLMRHERTIIQSEERQNTLTIELEKERAFSKRWEDKLHKNEEMYRKLLQDTTRSATKKAIKLTAKQQLRKAEKKALARPDVTRSTLASRSSAAAIASSITRIAERKKDLDKKVEDTHIIRTRKVVHVKRAPAASEKNNMALLKKANQGRDVPFILGQSTTPSFSIIGNVQHSIALSDQYAGTAEERREAANQIASSSTRKNSTTSNTKTKTTVIKKNGVNQTIPSIRIPHVKQEEMPVRTTAREEYSPATENMHHEAPAPTSLQDNLDIVLTTVEHEFNVLNDRYKKLTAQSDGGLITTDVNLSSTLHSLIDELESKGKQLFALRQAARQASDAKAASSTNNPHPHHYAFSHSPQALRKKQAALHVLQEYRELERSMT